MNRDIIALAQLHPFFSRLSGQVIWCLFEERDVPPEVIDAFMDRFGSWFRSCLETLRPVLTGDPAMPPYVRVLVDGAAWDGAAPSACASCAALHKAVIPTAHPHAVRFLPPYSLGCRARPVLLSQKEFAALDAPRMADLDGEAPLWKLTCDSEWIFSFPWA